MSSTLLFLIVSVFTIAMAIAALEAERISRSLVFLALSSIGIGTIFLMAGALYASVFEFLVYGGVLIILFMVIASFTNEEKEASS